ncbi:MAG: hypothetical protein WDM77_20535 [Steroidobacteraceae bacterium]
MAQQNRKPTGAASLNYRGKTAPPLRVVSGVVATGLPNDGLALDLAGRGLV